MVWLIAKSLTIFLLSVVESQRRCCAKFYDLVHELNTIKSYLMYSRTRRYRLECFWHSLVACWPSVAPLHNHVCVCGVYHCSWAWGADSCPAVCRFGACGGHEPTLRLRSTRSFVSVAWGSSSVAFFLPPPPTTSLPPLSWLRVSTSFPLSFFGGLFILLPLGFWPQCDECYSGGLGAGGLVAGLQVGRPVGVLLLWGVIAVAAPWPIGT